MVTLLFLLSVAGSCHLSYSCPVLCDQKSCALGLLLCSESGLNVIPEIPSQGITNVIIINQKFPKPVLTYKNLSRYGPEEITLKQMTIQNCGLTDVESESFSHLIHLIDLDLSQNDLRTIRPRSFKALNLKLLKLDGNRLLKLKKDSLKGLVVNALSLANCGLTELQFDSIREISGHLTKLILSDNKLKTLSFQFFLLFRRLEVIRLDNNELNCDCHLKWLIGILAKRADPQPPTCFTPPQLRGKVISSLPESLFECLIPSLNNIRVNILTAESATLSCMATSQSDAKVYWVHKNRVNTTTDPVESMNNASIFVKGSSPSDRYACYVVNDNGNVTVDLNIHWPSSRVVNHPPPLPDTFINVSKDSANRNVQYLFLKQFSFLEMILSIACTFIITIALFSLIYFFLARKIHFSKENVSLNRSGYDGGCYSDIPVYDVPQMTSPRRPYPSSPTSVQNTQLLDFKTQKLIPTHHQ